MNVLSHIPKEKREMMLLLSGPSPLTVLFGVYLAHPYPIGRKDLVALTGIGRDSVTKYAYLLEYNIGLITKTHRPMGWILTDNGRRQFELPGMENFPRALQKGDFIAFPSSSSSFISDKNELVQEDTTTTPDQKGDLIAFSKPAPEPLPENLEDLFYGLLLGYPRPKAEQIIRDALNDSQDAWTPEQIELELLEHFLHRESPAGIGLTAPAAHYALACVARRTLARNPLDEMDLHHPKHGDAWERWHTKHKAKIKRIKELEASVYP